ncbi:hypothetical protein R1flu_023285 [Riccia fluitans]|uniref:Uncharacterized protein n=1 Tax=Riccia fluitans TaxID=41844 RepID=A0ABD1XVP1_9MARC
MGMMMMELYMLVTMCERGEGSRANLLRTYTSTPHQKKSLHRQTSSPALGLKGHIVSAFHGHVDGKTGSELQVEENDSVV